MAPPLPASKRTTAKKPPFFVQLRAKYLPLAKKCLTDPAYTWPVTIGLLLVEFLLNIVIINRVNYTEIDWVAYMQECEGFLNGTLNYDKLRGDTGPLVYPAGFVYVYSALYYLTGRGSSIRTAQYIFSVVYLGQLYLSLRIYSRTHKVPPFALIITTLTSYRIHSIYVLRMFNDPVAVLLFYAALNLFLASRWELGSCFFSLAVSVKMSILLFAPCLFICFVTILPAARALRCMAICACVQLALGAPFLWAEPWAYIRGSFDLGRVFEHKWTVNWRFLPVWWFVSRWWHLGLLAANAVGVAVFLPAVLRYCRSYAALKKVLDEAVEPHLRSKKSQTKKKTVASFEKVSQLLVLPFFITNLVGVACARSLHYQFYAWYYHSLPYLAFSTDYSRPVIFLILALIELCWNCYPSTDWSSGLLHVCHAALLVGVYKYMNKKC